MGGEAIRELLKQSTSRRSPSTLRAEMREVTTSRPSARRLSKRLKVVEAFRERQQARLDDARSDPGHPAGTSSARPARRRPLRDHRSTISLSSPPATSRTSRRPRPGSPSRATGIPSTWRSGPASERSRDAGSGPAVVSQGGEIDRPAHALILTRTPGGATSRVPAVFSTRPGLPSTQERRCARISNSPASSSSWWHLVTCSGRQALALAHRGLSVAGRRIARRRGPGGRDGLLGLVPDQLDQPGGRP